MITVTGLGKSYGSHTGVDDISFVCPAGTVTGFLGSEGAGRTTTLRALTDMTPTTQGTVADDGRQYSDIPDFAAQIGVMLDVSAQDAGRTGREVLTVGALAMGLPKRRVGEVLRLVGLRPKEARRRIGGYSPGARQRLGIAHALLGNPRVLILDEPAAGLDPAGIRWLRTLVSEFARRGGTVLLSTRLLSEIEAVADHLVIVGDGRVLAAGSKEALLDGARLEDFYLGLTADAERDTQEEESLDFSFAIQVDDARRRAPRPFRTGLR